MGYFFVKFDGGDQGGGNQGGGLGRGMREWIGGDAVITGRCTTRCDYSGGGFGVGGVGMGLGVIKGI